MPPQMNAVVKFAQGPGHVELRTVPKPRPESDHVLLEVGAAGVCGTDLHILAGEYRCRPPVVLGHEFAGTIVELGEGVSGWSVGDRVTALPFASVCGECAHCQAGQYGLCASRLSYGSGVDGGFAQYLSVNASRLYPLPGHQDLVAGCLTEPLACVAKAVFEVGDLRKQESVVILGPGPIGLLTTQVARAVGAHISLIGLESDAARLDLGRTLGAEHLFHAEEPDLPAQLEKALGTDGVDVVFECSGAGAAFGSALQLVKTRGRVIQVGLFGKPVGSDLDLIAYKDLTVRGSFASSLQSWEEALSLTESEQVDTRCLVSDIFPLQDWQAAFTRASERSGLKVVLQPQ